MNKRRVALLTIDREIAGYFTDELNSIFNNLLDIRSYSLDMGQVPNIHDADLILYTDPSILINMMSKIKSKCPTLMMKRTISNPALDKIKKIEPNKTCLVVNINSFMANETLTTIYELGGYNISLYPFYEGMENIPDDVDYIISHDNYSFLPKIDAEVIIIGNRVFHISTILDIITLLDIDSTTSEKILTEYSFRVPISWQGIDYAIENRKILTSQWKILLNELSMAVIILDESDNVSLVNSEVSRIIGLDKFQLEGKNLKNLVNNYSELDVFLSRDNIDNMYFRFNDRKLILKIKKVVFNNVYYGKIILINTYDDMVKMQQVIHEKIIGKGHYSKYTFDSIIGKDESILEIKEICKKISDSDSTVLLMGDSGVGKEIFAGSIHNYSHRKDHPFIAINCATLPQNLLESELFGYEEGSFTGAKKGGKIGLLESANKGTLFLDEIGEIPLALQARLLRALQEKEIIRIGSDSVIKVDTRIIAATNKDLLQMVNEGKFRKDLFYRLNVFQIEIPRLRERVEDIPLLIEYFMENHNVTRGISNDFKIFCHNYSWPGNVRELFNVLEYMVNISSGDLCIDNLPRHLKKEKHINKKFNESSFELSYILLLKTVYKRQKSQLNTGRRSLCSSFGKNYYKISELRIRDMIEALSSKGYLTVNQGVRGCEITKEGESLLIDNDFITAH